MSAVAGTLAARSERSLLGHPRGLFYLAFTEAWERFSYYGMTALLMLYMVNQLLLPEHAAGIAGFGPARAALESLSGPLSRQALASQIFGLYTGLVYFTPIVGGWIADRWIGQRAAVVLGALAMSAGHIAMAFDASFLAALALLVVGSGLLKGNIATQVAGLYPPGDEARSAHGYCLFSTGINVGAVMGPLLCGLLAQLWGWHWGFGIAALFMLVGLATYLRGCRYLPARVSRPGHEASRLARADWRLVGALLAVMLITVFQSIAYYQMFNVNPIWLQQYVSPSIGGVHIPVPWYQSAHSLACIALTPPLLWFWNRQAARGREPDDLGKIGVGAWLACASNLVLVAGIFVSRAAPIAPVWPLLYCVLLGGAFMYYWPTLLALVARAAPAALSATLMGIAYMSLFVANIVIGWIGGFYERLTPTAFWTLHAAIAAGGGVLVALLRRPLGRMLAD